MTKEEKITWFEENGRKKHEYNKLYNDWLKNRNIEIISFGIPCDQIFGYLKEYLHNYGITSNINCSYYVNKYNVGDIIACSGFVLYQLDNNGNIITTMDDVSMHYVYITEIRNDGKIIVSS